MRNAAIPAVKKEEREFRFPPSQSSSPAVYEENFEKEMLSESDTMRYEGEGEDGY